MPFTAIGHSIISLRDDTMVHTNDCDSIPDPVVSKIVTIDTVYLSTFAPKKRTFRYFPFSFSWWVFSHYLHHLYYISVVYTFYNEIATSRTNNTRYTRCENRTTSSQPNLSCTKISKLTKKLLILQYLTSHHNYQNITQDCEENWHPTTTTPSTTTTPFNNNNNDSHQTHTKFSWNNHNESTPHNTTS